MTERRHDVREIGTSHWASVVISEYENDEDYDGRVFSSHVHIRSADEGTDLGRAESDESTPDALRKLAAKYRELADDLTRIADEEEAKLARTAESPA